MWLSDRRTYLVDLVSILIQALHFATNRKAVTLRHVPVLRHMDLGILDPILIERIRESLWDERRHQPQDNVLLTSPPQFLMIVDQLIGSINLCRYGFEFHENVSVVSVFKQ